MERPVDNSDGSRYYTRRQSKWRALLAGMTLRAFPRDYPEADYASGWTRVQDAIAEAEKREQKP